MLQRSTIQLLRFPFSYFLMPVFWFSLSFVHEINWLHAGAAFILIHVLLYPSSNGYNSYMDRDTGSIGGIKNPMAPTRQLYNATLLMDGLCLLASLVLSWQFALGILTYIIFSRLYSYRGIRLKQYPVTGYLTVIINQGALVFTIVYLVSENVLGPQLPFTGLVASAFLIGGFYPITQVYQHEADSNDQVRTISMLLGIRGTFLFCAVMYTIAFGLLFIYYYGQNNLSAFLVVQLFFIPVIVYFFYWFSKVIKNNATADFTHTMRMNMLASTCTNLAFITLTILNQIG